MIFILIEEICKYSNSFNIFAYVLFNGNSLINLRNRQIEFNLVCRVKNVAASYYHVRP